MQEQGTGATEGEQQRPRRRWSRRAVAIAGTTAGLLVVGTVAWAAIPSSNGGTFTACINKQTGATRMIDFQAGKRCASTETTAQWGRLVSAGAWTSSKAYRSGDLVTYQGSSYLARRSSTGRTPTQTTYWTVLAAKGATGAAGPTGPAGPTGAPGPTGAAGPSGVVTVVPMNNAINGPITLNQGFATWVFVGTPASVTVAESQTVVASGSAVLGTANAEPMNFAWCFQPAGGGAIAPLVGDSYQVIRTTAASLFQYTAQASRAGLVAGSYSIGLCAAANNVTFTSFDFVNGWVMVTQS